MQIGLQSFTKYLPKEMLKSLFDAGVVQQNPVAKEKEVIHLFCRYRQLHPLLRNPFP